VVYGVEGIADLGDDKKSEFMGKLRDLPRRQEERDIHRGWGGRQDEAGDAR